MTETNFPTTQPLCGGDDRPAGGIAGGHPELPGRRAVSPAGRMARNDRDSWRFELFLAFCSAWVAVQLWFWPGQFPLGDTPMALSAGLRGHEAAWALVCTLAAVLKLGGLACRFWTSWSGTSAALMICGLFMSIVLWTIIGATWAFDFPHSLAPVILIGGAFGAAWQLAQWKPPGPGT